MSLFLVLSMQLCFGVRRRKEGGGRGSGGVREGGGSEGRRREREREGGREGGGDRWGVLPPCPLLLPLMSLFLVL
jgi:hypothetical protein